MKISPTLPPPQLPRPIQRAVSPPALDRVELGAGGWLQKAGRMGKNLVINALAGALPAIGTATALALGGPGAAGLAIAASMVGTGIYTSLAFKGYSGKFAGGALLGGLSAACGCLGWPSQGLSLAVGPALFAGFGAAREGVKWLADLGENGSIDQSLR